MRMIFLKNYVKNLSAAFAAGFLMLIPVAANAGNIADITFEQTPLFGATDIMPGDSVHRWVKVANKVNDNLIISTAASSVDNSDHLGDRLFLVIRKDGVAIYAGTMSSFFAMPEVSLGTLGANQTGQYDFAVSFDSSASDSFKEKRLSFDIAVSAAAPESIGGETLPPTTVTTPPSGGGGGGGGYLVNDLVLTNINASLASGQTTASITVTWQTNKPATSRVIYDTVPHPDLSLELPPNYGYAFSTVMDTNKIAAHSVTISGLTPGQVYYLRPLSSASPEKYGTELAIMPSGSVKQTIILNDVVSDAPVATAAPKGQVKGIKITKASGASRLVETGFSSRELMFLVLAVVLLVVLRLLLTKIKRV